MGIALLDRELRVVAANRALCDAVGEDLDAIVSRPVEDLASAPLWAAAALRAAIASDAPVDRVETAGERSPGSGDLRRWTVSGRPVRGEGGGVVGLAVRVADETARRRSEASLADARDEAERAAQALIRLQAVTAALAAATTPARVARVTLEEAVGLLDAAAGSFSAAVAPDELEVLDALGYPEQSLVAWRRHGAELPPPLAEAFRSGRAVWLDSPDAFDRRYPHAAGAARPFAGGASAAVPLVAPDGRVTGVLGIEFAAPARFDPTDETFVTALAQQCAEALARARLFEERERLRDRAERAAALLETLFSGVPLGLGFVDRDLRIVHANAEWSRLTGVAPEACAGKPVVEGLPDGGADRAAGCRRVLERGEPVLELELSRAEPDDPSRVRAWVESWYPVRAGAETIGVGIVARDVTDEKRAEAFRRNVIGIVGHDLRNPLSAIHGYARLLARGGGLEAEPLRMVSRIEAAAAKADRIVGDLLDLTRVQSGVGVPVLPAPARVDEICAAVVDEASAAWPQRAVEVRGQGDPAVTWDPDRVAQALSNLVVNALKHGDPVAPVAVAWEARADDVEVRVANRGPPIPVDLRDHLFEPFRRGGGARGAGLGLGLFIAREVARAHGGTISAASSEPDGTVFTLRLPRHAPRR